MILRKLAFISLFGCLLLSACASAQAETPTAVQPAVIADPAVIVKGRLVPVRSVELGFTTNGQVAEVLVAEGEKVTEGQPIALLSGSQPRQAEVARAKQEALLAQQALDDFQRQSGLAYAQALQDQNTAQKAFEDAQKARDRLDRPRASTETIQSAEANYYLAQAAVDDAEGAFNRVSGALETDVARANALANLANAKKARDKALVNLNWYKGHAGEKEYTEADANLAVAEAELELANQDVERLKSGPDADLLAAAQARIATAQAALASAEYDLAGLELRAPFAGLVARLELEAGEFAVAGNPVVTLADVSSWVIETEDLNETDVVEVKVGQAAAITLDALPEKPFQGKIESIAQVYEPRQGDITYTATISLPALPAGARWGMTAEVRIEPGK